MSVLFFDKKMLAQLQWPQAAKYLSWVFFQNLSSLQKIIELNQIDETLVTQALELREVNSGDTLLHKAVFANNISLAKYLLQCAGFNPFIKNTAGFRAEKYIKNSEEMLNLFAEQNLLIAVENRRLSSIYLQNQVAMGAYIKFNGPVPDCIKGPKSYTRIMKSLGPEEKDSINLRLQQFLLSGPFVEKTEQAVEFLIKNILQPSCMTIMRPQRGSFSWLGFKEKTDQLRAMQNAYERLLEVYTGLYQKLDEDPEFMIPVSLVEMQSYQNKLKKMAGGSLICGTGAFVLGALENAAGLAGSSAFPSLFKFCMITGAVTSTAGLMIGLSSLLCCIPLLGYELCFPSADTQIENLHQRRQEKEFTVSQLFEEEANKEGFKITLEKYDRTQVIKALDSIRMQLRIITREHASTVKQSRCLPFFRAAEISVINACESDVALMRP